MSNYKGKRVTLEIVWDTEYSTDPVIWNWYEVLDLGNEDVVLVKAEDFEPDPKLIQELENH